MPSTPLPVLFTADADITLLSKAVMERDNKLNQYPTEPEKVETDEEYEYECAIFGHH